MTNKLVRWAPLCLLPIAAGLQAQGLSASLSLASDNIVRGVSQSSGTASLGGDLEWSHRTGGYIGLGASSVDPDQFGGASVQWSPRLGWRSSLGSHGDFRTHLGLSAHVFPGARGQRAASLPPRLGAAAGTQAQQTDFATAELNLGLGWKGWQLNLDRALTDYYGIGEAAPAAGTVGANAVSRVTDSLGSWHAGLSYRYDFNEFVSAWGGVGRQIVKNFDTLNYTDWNVGASLNAVGLQWTLEATGTTANKDYWRLQRTGGQTTDTATPRVTARATWVY